MRQSVEGFLETLTPGDVAFVYYSGYGMQVEGENYLVPVDFYPADDREVYFLTYSVSRLHTLLDERKARWRILVLDACRPAPALATRSTGEGLAPPGSIGNNALIVFSTLPGKTAADPPGRSLGLLAENLVAALQKPGLTLDEVFREVQKGVNDASMGEQVPSVISTVVEPFRFREAPPPAPPKPQPTKPGDVKENPKDTLQYVWFSAGTFQMGCAPADGECTEDEKPRHQVTISRGFWIGRTEVTAFAYGRFARATKRTMPRPTQANPRLKYTDHPIIRVNWETSKAFCEWAGGRLPTEAEWEYAARGDLTDAVFPWQGDLTREKANYEGTQGTDQWVETSPMRSFEPNPLGLYDMAGNVWEWVSDLYGASYYCESAADPKGPSSGKGHVMRGGSWYSGAKHLRVSARSQSETEGNNIGFRCVLDRAP